MRTEFNTSELTGAKFTDVKLIDVKLTMLDLEKTVFENCTFNGVDFKYCDLRGLCLDGLTFIGVKFDSSTLNEVTFKGATLRNVSFRPAFALTNKYYRAIKTINFDGAMMDKLTYAALKGLGSICQRLRLFKGIKLDRTLRTRKAMAFSPQPSKRQGISVKSYHRSPQKDRV